MNGLDRSLLDDLERGPGWRRLAPTETQTNFVTRLFGLAGLECVQGMSRGEASDLIERLKRGSQPARPGRARGEGLQAP